MGLKRHLQDREGPHVGPSIWHDIYPRLFATILVVVAWLAFSGWLLKTAKPEDLRVVQFWGTVIVGGLVFFGAGDKGFGN
jgi:hypothetical protein